MAMFGDGRHPGHHSLNNSNSFMCKYYTSWYEQTQIFRHRPKAVLPHLLLRANTTEHTVLSTKQVHYLCSVACCQPRQVGTMVVGDTAVAMIRSTLGNRAGTMPLLRAVPWSSSARVPLGPPLRVLVLGHLDRHVGDLEATGRRTVIIVGLNR